MTVADYVRAPTLNSSGNESTAIFTATTDSANNAVPKFWEGKFVEITPVGGNLWFYFSSSSSSEVDRTAAASAAGNTGATVGRYLANGETRQFIVPISTAGGHTYFVREADATTTVYMGLTS